ncbi:MAG: protein tyrosine phosphatase family protein [Jaaginema sp. PMC 1079.18]|nr:protein tyrosine phosphatase family protein [Jaaginema sp. PMC 1080.18]MEC4849766.1 protein tyrosine phosphatase family protein [Jaaginema sp. PMC 1079.18]MEC4866629.1 protein tyrosine phosphatase family protein [Jaaginema sp. PMC 1078.18]
MAIAGEAEIVRNLEMQYSAIPVIWEDPQLADFEQFCTVMDDNRDRPVWVHCAANKRVSVFVYLDRCRRDPNTAALALADLQAIWTPNPVWAQFIATILQNNALE